jgi:small subunit ribosomal protein S21
LPPKAEKVAVSALFEALGGWPPSRCGQTGGKMPYYLAARSTVGTSTVILHTPQYARDAVVKLTLREKETAQEAVRRFRKLVERSGIKKEIRVREFYEKPSETKRRARLRAERRNRRERTLGRA